MPQYYLTTPIYYINDRPHIGHAYCTTLADVLARYHRLKGEEVFFLTGTDENSLKNVEAAEKAGYSGRLQEYLDLQSGVWQKTWQDLGITNTDFIRTTEERHKKGVEKFFKVVYENGDIYKGTYQGWYCRGCEAFVRESDLVEGLCPFHKTQPDRVEEENYFFRASAYRDQLLSYIEKNPGFIEPESRRNEIVNYIRDYFEDVSISRPNLSCGIPLPIDSGHVVYVWFDALINYLTGVGYGWNDDLFARWWPADLHLVGKDIIKFHCALWPAMLLSAGLPLPKKVFAHGFFTINGEKVSKSLGNAIDPVELAQTYGLDPLRYVLLSEIPFGGDGDFSFERVRQRYESDLSKGLGNFVSRVTTLAAKLSSEDLAGGLKGESAAAAAAILDTTWKQWENGFENYHLDESLAAIWALLRWGDRHIEERKPWILAKEHPAAFAECLTALSEVVRQLSLLIKPILPDTSGKIENFLGVADFHDANPYEVTKAFGAVTLTVVEKATSLFPPLDVKSIP